MDVFILDFDKNYTLLLTKFFTERKNCSVRFFPDVATAMDHLHERPDILILNTGVVRVCPIKLMKAIKALHPIVEIFVMVNTNQKLPSSEECINLIEDVIIKDDFFMFRLELLWRNFEIKRSHKELNTVLEQKLISLERQHRVRLTKEVLEKLSLDDIQNDVIQQHLSYYKNNVQDVANKLKIGKSTIYRLIRENKV
ncbi:MAG: hypothetical protein U0U66_13055 [Cytophagaceae bacterium]